jgi:hypothetical protein
VKYQDKAGKKYVRVSLRYYSRELKELAKLNIDAKDLFPLDFLQEIKDVYVSLRSEGKIISDPYEKTISSLSLEQERQVTFQQERNHLSLFTERAECQHSHCQFSTILPRGRFGERSHV